MEQTIEKNQDTQNNLEPDTSHTLIHTTTSLKDVPKVKCDTIGEALKAYETSEYVEAQPPEHKCDTMKHEKIKEFDVERKTVTILNLNLRAASQPLTLQH